MDNDSFEEDSNVYVNCPAPDVIIGQPITSQPSSKPAVEEPIATKAANDVKTDDKKIVGSRKRVDTSDTIYSLDAEQARRDWASGLFSSFKGNPHTRTFKDTARKALRDCGCMACMMCSIATRLGDPGYLPFVPCTGTAVRFKVRILGGITGTICNDCLVTSFCWPCAVCQMYREVEDIGI